MSLTYGGQSWLRRRPLFLFFPPVRAGDAGGRRKRSSSQAHDGEALPGSKYRSSKNFAADNEIHVMQRCKADQSMADNQGRSYQTEPGGYRGISHPKISQGIAEISHRAESELASTLWCTRILAEIVIVQLPEIDKGGGRTNPQLATKSGPQVRDQGSPR
jgi:hypothetical protein